jgi:glycosyltransferase involved in cell wall biosynthesis
MKAVFLYTELADYFLKCCEALSEHMEVHIIRWPVNKEAPFRFSFSGGLRVYNKNDYTLKELESLIDSIQPDILFCSGWIDKDYLKLVRPYFRKIPTVLTCDTHWRGDLKQYVAVIASRFYLLNRFSHAWVPGLPQSTYARKLGFKPERIHQGFYSCDLGKFNQVYTRQEEHKRAAFPKRLLYVGRYYEFKGIQDLWQAFTEIQEETPDDWELWCLGAGDLPPVEHPRIRHFGFVQPEDLGPVLEQTGVFVLPSRFEPWGVVVHEFAAAGFPLLLSRAVGAREAFLEEGKNGFSFPPGDVAGLKKELKKLMSLDAKALFLMSEESHRKAQKISPGTWTQTVLSICHESRNE